MELLESNDKNELRHTDFYGAYKALKDIDIYEFNMRYYDEEFIIKLFSKIKIQKATANSNYRLHSNFILFSPEVDKIEKVRFATYKEYLEYCVSYKISHVPMKENYEGIVSELGTESASQKLRSALNLSHVQKRTVYDICATLGRKTHEVYLCKKDCVLMYLTRKNYLKYQNLAIKAFRIKREFLTNIFSPIENFEKMYCKLINALTLQLMFRNHILFNVNDSIQYIYIIKKGEIELSYKAGDDDPRLTPVLRCTRGSLVGEFEVMSARSARYLKATVLSSECIVYCIQVEYFKLFLNLSKPFRKKILAQAKEKYKRIINWSASQADLMRNFVQNKFMLHRLKGSVINSRCMSFIASHIKVEYHKDPMMIVNDSTPLKVIQNSKDRSMHNHNLLRNYLKRNNSAAKFTIKTVKQEGVENEAILKRSKNFSLSNYIQSTTDYVNNHIGNSKRRHVSKEENNTDFYFKENKSDKFANGISETKLQPLKRNSNSYRYFASYLKNRFTDYNSYYSTVLDTSQGSPTPDEQIQKLKHRLKNSLRKTLLAPVPEFN